jgi:hypothetical protein
MDKSVAVVGGPIAQPVDPVLQLVLIDHDIVCHFLPFF